MARAYRNDKPYPPADAGKAVDGKTVYPAYAWTDHSGRVYVAFGRYGQVYAASFDRMDLHRLLAMEMGQVLGLRQDPTLGEHLRVVMQRLRVVPSRWAEKA